MLETINVQVTSELSYPITVGDDIWKKFHSFCADNYSSQKLVVIIDERVHSLHGENIQQQCQVYFDQCVFLTVPEGEQSKSTGQWNKLVDSVLKEGVERTTPVLVVGGGVTGDVGGFTAASVLRGLPLIHMPTSLLAMVDSSIGGKTGINHTTGKNLIGAFYQPDAVFAGVNFLETLDRSEWINGLAEILKYAAIQDPSLFDQAAGLVQQGFTPSENWVNLISKCAAIKADIVQQDMLEGGVRAVLNFGHTFAHALEKQAGYGTVSHGEAVFTGMLAAVYVSRQQGAAIEYTRFAPFIPLYDIHLNKKTTEIDKLLELMTRDKKVKGGKIRLILLEDWGTPCIRECEDSELIRDAWQFAFTKLIS